MSFSLHIKSADVGTESHRRQLAEGVLRWFGDRLPNLQLLCFLDDEEWQDLREKAGIDNRGAHFPLGGALPRFAYPPVYLQELLAVNRKIVFDNLIYLYGSTCTQDIGLTMTLAHELQHFVQYGCSRRLWAANTLIPNLPREVIARLQLTWCDLPHEYEARLVSKRVAEAPSAQRLPPATSRT